MLKDHKLGLLLALLFAGSMWFYVQHILVGHQQTESELHGIPRGNLSDLYPRWLGARELLLHHRDPYSPEITREIQVGYYGRALDPTRPYDPRDQQGFAYPVYVAFLLAPTVRFQFETVQTGFRWLLIGLTVATVFLWLRTFRWWPSSAVTAALVVLTLGSFQVLQAIKLQQLTLFVSGLIALCAFLLVEGHLAAAGALLAFATIKPQLVLPVTAWLFVWAVSDWRRRANFILGFVLIFCLLFGGAQYVLPGWLGRFHTAVRAYRQYGDGAQSVLEVLLTPAWGRVAAGVTMLALAIKAWRLRKHSTDSPAFGLMLALVLATTVMIVPKAAPYNQALLLPAMLLIAKNWQVLWERSLWSRIFFMICWLVILWPWLSATAIAVAYLGFGDADLLQAWAVPVWTVVMIPLAVVMLLACNLNDFLKPDNRPTP